MPNLVDNETVLESSDLDDLMDDALDSDLDSLLDGVRPAAEFVSPIPGSHIFIARPHFSIANRETEDGILLAASIIYEILATASNEATEVVGSLLSENVKLGGAVPEYEKYSAAKQIADGKALLLTRLLAFYHRLPGVASTTGVKPSQMLAAIKDYYKDTGVTGHAVRMRITAKQKGEYVNIRSIKVLDGSFPLLADPAAGTGLFAEAELADYSFFTPTMDE